jgi:hypothetical protein
VASDGEEKVGKIGAANASGWYGLPPDRVAFSVWQPTDRNPTEGQVERHVEIGQSPRSVQTSIRSAGASNVVCQEKYSEHLIHASYPDLVHDSMSFSMSNFGSSGSVITEGNITVSDRSTVIQEMRDERKHSPVRPRGFQHDMLAIRIERDQPIRLIQE